MGAGQPLAIDLDFRSHTPIYTQIVDAVQRAVGSGAIKPGDQLPTVRQMAADLRVNFNTVARAYRLLDDEGVISTQHGRGTYVLEPAKVERSRRARWAALDRLTESYLAAASRLGHTPEEVERRMAMGLARWARRGSVVED